MKIEIVGNRVRIEYLKREWEKLEKYYQMLRLQRYTTNNLFGKGINAEVYRYVAESKRMLVNDLQQVIYASGSYSLQIIDDINKPIMYYDSYNFYFNLAVFRVIPRLNSDRYILEYEINDEESIFIPIPLINDIRKFFKDVVKGLLKKIENIQYQVKISVEIIPLT